MSADVLGRIGWAAFAEGDEGKRPAARLRLAEVCLDDLAHDLGDGRAATPRFEPDQDRRMEEETGARLVA